MVLPAPTINAFTNPSLEATTGTQLVWTNLCINPTMSTNVTGYTANSGTGGTSTVVQGSVTPIAGYSGPYFAKQTWTVGTSAVSGGMDFASVSPGTGLLYVSAYVAVTGVATQRLQFSFTGTATYTTTASQIATPIAGNWMRIEAWLNVTVAGTVIPHLYAITGTSSSNWVASSTLLVDGVTIVKGVGWPASVPHFNGDTTDVGSANYAWTGTANASTSTWTSGVPTGMTGLGSATVYQEPGYFHTQGNSGAILCTGASTPGATLGTVSLDAGTQTISCWIYWPVPLVPNACTLTVTGGLAGTHTLTPVAGTWTQLHVTGTGTTASTTVKVTTAGSPVAGSTWYVDSILAIDGTRLEYFDGNSSPDSFGAYSWAGTVNASASQSNYRGVWIDPITGTGCPKAQITVSGMGNIAGTVQVTRTEVDNNETWTVPGWSARNVVDSDTDTDYAPPLNRDVTYTCYLNGQQVNQVTTQITSTTGWVQDPYDASTAMPINATRTDDSVLTLAAGSFANRQSSTNSVRVYVMGSRRAHSVGGQRQTDSSMLINLNAWRNDTSDGFKSLADAPVLLFRGLPSWGSMPGLMYTDGTITENAVNRMRVAGNNALTEWTVSGDLVQPITRPPITGRVTNDDMQTNLSGTTYDAIKARSGAKRYIDIKADPLSL